jgi:DNA repair protein RadC
MQRYDRMKPYGPNWDKSFKEWPEDEWPRERLFALGLSMLSKARILTILIWQGNVERTNADLLERFGSLAYIEPASIEEICGAEGLGPAQAIEIKAAIERGRRFWKSNLAGASSCSSLDMVEYYRPLMKNHKKKISRCTLHDTKYVNLREKNVPIGSLTVSNVHPHDTIKATIRESATTAIYIQLSRDLQPSKEDLLLTKRRVQAAEVLGIHVIDYSNGGGGYFSFKDKGLPQHPA